MKETATAMTVAVSVIIISLPARPIQKELFRNGSPYDFL